MDAKEGNSKVKRDSPGRPPHEPTATARRRVAVLAGGGWSQDDIAAVLEIDRNTLAKHYMHELTVGAREKREEILEAMRKAAKKGSVPAARLYLQNIGQVLPATALADESIAPSPIADGLKAARDRAATTAHTGTEWAEVLARSKPLQ